MSVLVKDNPVCKNCPYRLYQKDTAIVKKGQGNVAGNGIIIVKKEKDIEILEEIYKAITDREIYEDFYVLHMFKCKYSRELKFNRQAGICCTGNIMNEIKDICMFNVFVFGTTAMNFIAEYINNSRNAYTNKFFHFINYEPSWYNSSNIVLRDTFIHNFKEHLLKLKY